MRLYPPAATLSREAIGEDWLAGARIPAGTTVTVAPYLLHRHRRLWKDPDAFDPERFLGANRDAIDRYAYIPFGAGPRVCIGMSFALQEAVIVLAHLLARVSLRASARPCRRTGAARDAAATVWNADDRTPPRARVSPFQESAKKGLTPRPDLPISRQPTALPL